MGARSHLVAWTSYFVFFLAPAFLSPLVILIGTPESKCAYVVLLMAVYWVSECLPVGVTALLPVILFPCFQIMSTDDTAKEYMNAISMLMIGGLMAAVAIEYWNIHKRLALRILTFVGSEPRWLMLGLMSSTWFMSIWLSNTASTAMMLPITEAILEALRDTDTQDDPALKCQERNDVNFFSNYEDESGEGNEFQVIKQQDTAEENQESGKMLLTPRVGFPTTATSSSEKSADPLTLLSSNDDNSQRESNSPSRRSKSPYYPGDDPHYDNMAKGMVLSICYAANCGGIASLTGTGPNLVLKREVDELYESHGLESPVTFGRWFLFGLPMSIAVVTTAWISLQVLFLRCRPSCLCCKRRETTLQERARKRRVTRIIRDQYNALGPLVCGQVLVCILFVSLVILWVTRDMAGVVGWGRLFEIPVKGGSIAILTCILTFGFPSTFPFLKSYPYTSHPETDPIFGRMEADRRPRTLNDHIAVRPLLNWKFAVQRFPWSLLLLVGGGYCISAGCKTSGLSAWIGNELTYFKDWSPYVIMLIICCLSAAATEFATNSATTAILLPILQNLALSTRVHPLKYMLTACFACSFSYMLPVATPPNAIIFTSGRLKMADMMKAGFVMNVISVLILVGLASTLGNVVFGFDDIPHQFLNTTSLS